ncbi:MAG: hypothetical protein INR71_02415 [Terriglobus roseus]|nr:hypothetical protein [Terriglobus roseus]
MKLRHAEKYAEMHATKTWAQDRVICPECKEVLSRGGIGRHRRKHGYTPTQMRGGRTPRENYVVYRRAGSDRADNTSDSGFASRGEEGAEVGDAPPPSQGVEPAESIPDRQSDDGEAQVGSVDGELVSSVPRMGHDAADTVIARRRRFGLSNMRRRVSRVRRTHMPP